MLDELLERVVAWRKGEHATRQVISVHLESGTQLQGMVLDVHEGRSRRTLALQGLPQRGTPDLDVTLVPLDHIQAVTLHAAQREVTAAVPPSDVTSSLELKRRARALGDLIAARIGTTVPVEIGTGDVGALGSLLAGLETALAKVFGDELGRAAFRERIQRVTLEVGASSGVRLRDGTLGVASTVSPRLPHDRLAAELDAVL
jgi:hypothetical protein